MADLLVKLYALPADAGPAARGMVRRAMAFEKHMVLGWVRTHFGQAWGSECDVAYGNRPISCLVMIDDGTLLGFACYDATCRGFFGPIGVAEHARRQGIGRTLLLATLRAMSAAGYGYAIVGGAGDPAFYVRTVGAIEIPGSTPGIYRDRLKDPPA